MKPLRPVALIRLELETATRYRDAYEGQPAADEFARQQRDDNDAEISRLTEELTAATAGDLEISLTGAPVAGHDIQLSYFNRVTESVQTAYRAAFRALATDGRLHRGEATLSIAATSPGSFKVALRTPPVQLELIDDPPSDRAMNAVIGLFDVVSQDPSDEQAQTWAASASEPEVRSMIKLASTVASSKGLTQFRWRSAGGAERTIAVSAASARAMAIALAGQMGREVVTVEGHVRMAQDEPPRVRIVTSDDEYLARVTDELLDQIKALVFDEVRATLLIDMRTSATSGSPSTITDLIEIEPAGTTRDESVRGPDGGASGG